MARYEMALVAESTGEAEAVQSIKALVEGVVAKHTGTILSVVEWGEKSLVYEVAKHDRGYYLIYQLELAQNTVKKIKKLLLQDRRILRVVMLLAREDGRK